MGYQISTGKVYKLKNYGTGKFLTFHDASITSSLNVYQYSEAGSNNQKWEKIGTRLCCHENNSYCLDRYKVGGSTQNNADIWLNNDAENQELEFGVNNGYLTIKLKSNGLYLTASSRTATDAYLDQSGNSTACKAPAALGNVYWDIGPTNYSRWDAIEVPAKGEQVFVDEMPNVPYYNNRGGIEDFHSNSGMISGTWEENDGNSIRNKIRAFYYKVFKDYPADDRNYLNNLYGAEIGNSGTHHLGIDINKGNNSKVYAPVAGELVAKGTDSHHTIGIYDGTRTYYFLHMNPISISENSTQVTIGDELGVESDYGPYADGVHLHVEIYKGRVTHGPKNPVTANQKIPSLRPYNYL